MLIVSSTTIETRRLLYSNAVGEEGFNTLASLLQSQARLVMLVVDAEAGLSIRSKSAVIGRVLPEQSLSRPVTAQTPGLSVGLKSKRLLSDSNPS